MDKGGFVWFRNVFVAYMVTINLLGGDIWNELTSDPPPSPPWRGVGV